MLYQTAELDEAGKLVITSSREINPHRCPFLIMVGEHYREDGSCKCDDPEHRKFMIAEWEYSESDFEKIPLRLTQ